MAKFLINFSQVPSEPFTKQLSLPLNAGSSYDPPLLIAQVTVILEKYFSPLFEGKCSVHRDYALALF